ncbi:MAG: HEAT repeat domain-containing protein [Deltaproteobacteria bacterium]|nr:HEAT repeat domain-containing protein [Deltaproteobacteria bacterium]
MLGVTFPERLARGDRLDELSRAIEHDRDDKARIAAAVALGKIADPRSVPALIQALGDKSPVVRGLAATALGRMADPRAIAPLERALGDGNEVVRARARDALFAIRAKPGKENALLPSEHARIAPKESPKLAMGTRKDIRFRIIVKSVANKTPRGSKDMTNKMRDHLMEQLQRSPEVTVDTPVGLPPHAGKKKLSEFAVDGQIAELSHAISGPWVEVSCQVRLSISTPDGRMLSIVTGGATVQTPRSHFRVTMERSLQAEALENAVRGAHQNMMAFLTRYAAATPRK